MAYKKHKNTHKGAALLFGIFSLLFFVLLFRFVQLQTTGKADGQVLAVKAEQKYEQKRTIEAKRGTILDRNGEVLAEDTPSYTLVAVLDPKMTTDPKDPKHVVDPDRTAQKLAPLLHMEVSEVKSILTKKAKQVEFGAQGRNISYELKKKIEALKLPGIGFIRDTKRFYPNGTFASYVIGYAQKEEDTGKTAGAMGIEKSLNRYLHEKDGYVFYQSDKEGFRLPDTKEKIVPPDNGDEVYLTIDQKIQTFLEDAMNQVEKQYKPKKIIAIVVNPKTGEVLAMGTRPSFDPNKRNITNYLNDAISYPYEPGSTMKVFTLAAAINEGVYNGNELYRSGSYRVGKNEIRDHNKVGWGVITFNEGVQRSSNVAFAKLVKEKLGEDRFLQYLHRFHFHEKTGIDLPGEGIGNILYRYPIEKLTTAFGQGTSITPIQQIQAATAIANDGKMMKPYIVDRIIDPDTKKVVMQNKPEVVGEPITKETSEKVLDILETVVTSEKGTGRPYQIEGYHVAGKTGTAQIPSPKGGYLTGYENYIFSFLGMAPKEDPKLLMYVAVQQPKLSYTETGAAPVSMIFNSVMKNSLQYLNIRPASEETEKTTSSKKGIELSSYHGWPVNEAVQDLKAKGLQPVVIGNGEKIAAQLPSAGDETIIHERVVLKTDGTATMPDLNGWSLRDVMKAAELLQLNPSIKGSGYVITQSIRPKTVVKANDYLIVELAEPDKWKDRINQQKEKKDEKKKQPVD
ncbi:penicillin-binding protein [Anoxybacillus rupiensis]|uniref:Penicillin-binding protein n=1 Tax=Anoxybacteroides rupiense TaxID=311460 RepID=A0ABT5W125_9BACL|nr:MULTISPECIES: penicillin-binding protein [Anoxybacillus]KXG10452.1 Penicillin-binding protein 2B [Anoxybacillus sp. P3H1B]MBB3906264.1 penicillin-binding protein 2B [Anoxybacillus rupiensis]MBS2770752.1 penicillin-binding protein [Anoxybacillus rupiensis]MDE8563018.1 penicillin-binding protein [Anoxybacillus rupiensis]OQM46317.1 penicillin-binding protein [Anoxybacillus sp. UARK-01]